MFCVYVFFFRFGVCCIRGARVGTFYDERKRRGQGRGIAVLG